jgi:hypothetical protein
MGENTSKKDSVRITRDEKGRVIAVDGLEAFPEGVGSMLLVPFVDSIRNAVQDFDKSTEKYSKRMEKLTIAMLVLAVTQVIVAIASIAIVIYFH